MMHNRFDNLSFIIDEEINDMMYNRKHLKLAVIVDDIKCLPSTMVQDLYYYSYFAHTVDNILVCWAELGKIKGLSVGDKVNIGCTFLRMSKNGKYRVLDNVFIIKDDTSNYPDDGYHYDFVDAEFLKVNQDWFLVKMSDGCKYFIGNRKYVKYGDNLYQDYDLKFYNWKYFKVGQRVQISGNVKSYNNKNGFKGHKLTNVRFYINGNII